MKYTIYIGASRLKIFQQLSPNDLIYLISNTKYRPYGYQFSPQYKMRIWDGYKKLVYKNQTAPAPLYLKITSILKKLGHTYELIWENPIEPIGKAEVKTLELDDLQHKAIERAIKYKYCAIEAAIRSGKTAMTAAMFNRIGCYPGVLITQGKDLVLQTRNEYQKFLDASIGFFSESAFEPGDILVTSYAALIRLYGKETKQFEERNREIKKIIARTKVLILDECHHAFSVKSQKILENFTNIGYKISVSGTVKPDKVKKIEMESVIGKVVNNIRFKELIERGRIAKPKIILYDLPRAWYRDYLPEYKDIYDANIMENELRNRFIASLVAHASKKDKTVFIMVRRRPHGEILNSLIPEAVYVHGDTDSGERKILYDRLQNKTLKCIIATVGKEGLNIPRLDIVINAEGLAGEVVTVQKMRSLTGCSDKEKGIVIDFMDHGKYLDDHSLDRCNKYESLDGFEIKKKKVSKDIFNEQ